MAGHRGQQEVLTRSSATTAYCLSRLLNGRSWPRTLEQLNREQLQYAAVVALRAGGPKLRQICLRAVSRSAGGRLSSHEPCQVFSPSLQPAVLFEVLQVCAALWTH